MAQLSVNRSLATLFASGAIAISGCSNSPAVTHPSGSDLGSGVVAPLALQNGLLKNGFVNFVLPNYGQGLTPGGLFITRGIKNEMWYTASVEPGKSYFAKIDFGGHVIQYAFPTSGTEPTDLTAGSDGNIWILEYNEGKIAKVFPPTGSVTEYPLLSSNDKPWRIASGPNGLLWFTLYGQGRIGSISTSGAVSEYGPTTEQFTNAITAGPDGNMWFTDGLHVGKITPTGQITEYADPYGSEDIITGPDGNLWVTTASGVAKMDTSGNMTLYPVQGFPLEFAPGDSDTLYFTYENNKRGLVNGVASITMEGTVTYYPFGWSVYPYEMAQGADGNEWVRAQNSKGQSAYVLIRSVMTLTPRPLTFSGTGQNQEITVSETNYSGTWTASTSNSSVVTVSPGSSSNTFTVTSIGTGRAAVSVHDSMGNWIKAWTTVQ